MRWSKLKTWILCATAILSVGALGISVHCVKEDTELMEVAAESIAASTATVTFNLGKAQLNGLSASARYFDVADPSDPNGDIAISNHSETIDAYSGASYGGWAANFGLSTDDSFISLSTDHSSVLTISSAYNQSKDNGTFTYSYFGKNPNGRLPVQFYLERNTQFTPISFALSVSNTPWDGQAVLPLEFFWQNYGIDHGSTRLMTMDGHWVDFSRNISYGQEPTTRFDASFNLLFSTSGNDARQRGTFSVMLRDVRLTFTSPELQFAAACSAYRNLGFTYDKNEEGEFTAFRNARLRFKLNLPSDYSAYIDNENVSVRVKFKNGEAYSEMVLEGSTFMSDGSGGYTCTFSLTNIPPEHFQDEISFIPIIEGMDLVEQTGIYRTPKCCVITLGASVKSMVDAYLGDLYSSLTEAQQEAITAFAEYYASYLA